MRTSRPLGKLVDTRRANALVAVVGGDLDVADAERPQQLAGELLEVGRVELAKLLQHLLLGIGVVLGNLLLNARLQPGGEPDHPLAVTYEPHGLAALFGARVLRDDLRVESGLRGLAARLDQVLVEHHLRDVAVVHRLGVAVPLQHVMFSPTWETMMPSLSRWPGECWTFTRIARPTNWI